MRLKDQHKQRAIVRAVLDLTNEKGLAGLKMSELARRAGVATGTLYTYFEDKQDLLLSVNRSVREGGASYLNERMTEATATTDRLRDFITVYSDYVGANYEAILFVDLLKRSPYMTDAARTETLENYRFLVNLIEAGIEEGTIVDDDPEVLLHIIDSVIKGIIGQQFERSGSYDPGGRDAIMNYAWAAIAKR